MYRKQSGGLFLTRSADDTFPKNVNHIGDSDLSPTQFSPHLHHTKTLFGAFFILHSKDEEN